MKNHFYIPSSISQRDDMPLWDLESLENDSNQSPIPRIVFVQHVDMLHADENLGFRKELDYILSVANGAQINTGNFIIEETCVSNIDVFQKEEMKR